MILRGGGREKEREVGGKREEKREREQMERGRKGGISKAIKRTENRLVSWMGGEEGGNE